MKLVAPDVGWVLQDRLYWTIDNGRHWKEITPHDASSREIASVFFLNASTDWALLTLRNQSNDATGFDLASTRNSGESWAITHVNIPSQVPGHSTPLAGGAELDFIDLLHGWMNFDLVGSSAFNPGGTINTRDGGKTWSDVGGPPVGTGSIYFLNVDNGWATDREHLYVTHNGGKKWNEISLTAPSQVYPVRTTYSLPMFVDRGHGFLPVNYSGAMVLFTSVDAGHNWKPDRVLTYLPGGQFISNTVAPDGIWVVAARPSSGHKLTLTEVGPQRSITKTTGALVGINYAGVAVVSELSFRSATNGWARVGDNLLATADAGTTWTNITPICERILNLPKGVTCGAAGKGLNFSKRH